MGIALAAKAIPTFSFWSTRSNVQLAGLVALIWRSPPEIVKIASTAEVIFTFWGSPGSYLVLDCGFCILHLRLATKKWG